MVKEEKRIAVFGEDVLWSKPFPLKNTAVHFFGLEEEGLEVFDPIVIVAGTISSRLSQEKQRTNNNNNNNLVYCTKLKCYVHQ